MYRLELILQDRPAHQGPEEDNRDVSTIYSEVTIMKSIEYANLITEVAKKKAFTQSEYDKLIAGPALKSSNQEKQIKQTPSNNSFLKTPEGKFFYNIYNPSDPSFEILSNSSHTKSAEIVNAYNNLVDFGSLEGDSSSRNTRLKKYYLDAIEAYNKLINTIEAILRKPVPLVKNINEEIADDRKIIADQQNVDFFLNKIQTIRLVGQTKSKATQDEEINKYLTIIKSAFNSLMKVYDSLKDKVIPITTSLNGVVKKTGNIVTAAPNSTGGYGVLKVKPKPPAPKPDPQIQARTNPPRPAPPPKPGRR